jgi:hypothetical protein
VTYQGVGKLSDLSDAELLAIIAGDQAAIAGP